jgi:type 1 glutamine amidotransferase
MTLLAAACLAVAAVGPQDAPRRIVLIAGPLDSHPRDTHEYERNVVLLKHCIDRSAAFRGARAEIHFDWPADPAALDGASAILLTSGGGDHRLEDHPLHVGGRFEQLRRQMERGCGVVFFHWSTFHPAARHEQITEWAGGYFDYETGPGKNRWYSRIATKEWSTVIGAPEHPVARGVRPFKVREEFYSRIRFRDQDPRLSHLLLQEAGDARENSVAWAVERTDGGRGFGFTGGHFYENWWNEDFRRLVLNAIAWTSGLEVPAGGVPSELPPPVRALVLTGHHHPAHDWRATTAALVGVLERDPRIRAEVAEGPEELEARLERAGLLVLNYNNWDRPGLTAPQKAAILGFLERGGGLVVVHFANGAWNPTLPAKDSDWEDYRLRLVRRVWMHPESAHDPFGPFRVEIPPGDHEIVRGLSGFDTVDELYVKQAGEAPVEPLAQARSKITGRDEPLAWAYEIGAARVFQTLLGHSDVGVRRAGDLLRRGAAWAARRAPLGFDPPGLPERPLVRPGTWKPRPQEPPAPPTPGKSSKVLPPDPGLDGGKGGHWGTTGEKDWVDARWNRMDVGPFMQSSLRLPAGPVARSVAVRLPGGGACFDADALGVRAAWTGGFLAFSPARYGVIDMPKPAGELRLAAPPGPLWNEPGAYRGLHLSGPHVVISYRVGEADVLERLGDGTRTWKLGPRPRELQLALADGGVEADLIGAAALHREGGRLFLKIPAGPEPLLLKVGFPTAGRAPPEDPSGLLRGGPWRWGDPLVLRGRLGREPGPYVLDTLPVPFENPWKALMFLTGVDFLPDGDLAVCSLHGDVWRVSGVDAGLDRVSWKRMAAGLFQPIGLRVVDGEVHVLGRDRITRLRDLDGDGEADAYESVAPLGRTSTAGHDYAAGLEIDAEGNFLYVDPKGLHRIGKDGSHRTLAAGWRNPVGLSAGPDGTITVAPQEGEWTPASAIAAAKEGGWYGFGGPRDGVVDPPLCWIPRGLDNSSGGQAWVTSDRWGPLSGALLGFSFGQSSMMLVVRERVDGVWQGGVAPFRLTFASGAMRGRFSPHDGQLYVAGTKGWVTNAARDGCLQRVRYTGAEVVLPVAMRTSPGRLALTFSAPLDRETAESPDRWAGEEWNYVYGPQYGSKEYSRRSPGVEGHDPVEIPEVRLSEDGRTATLAIPGLGPVMQLRLRYNLRSAKGTPARGEYCATIHRLGR